LTNQNFAEKIRVSSKQSGNTSADPVSQ